MSACVIWLDSEHAKIFKISASGVEPSHLDHHTIHPDGRHHDAHKHDAEEKFFQELTKKIGSTEELLIFGAGVAKNHLKTYIEKHNANLAKHIVGVETLDRMSDNQILEASRKFLKKHHMFHSNI